MPRLVEFLKDEVKGDRHGFIYRPKSQVEWDVRW
jgi:hypothetical protein